MNFQTFLSGPGKTQATVAEKVYRNDAIDFTGGLEMAGIGLETYDTIQRKEAAALKAQERSAYRQMQMDKYQRELASDALYMEAYREANSAAAALEQGHTSLSDFELKLRQIQDKYSRAGVGKADELRKAITGVAESKGVTMSYDLYKSEKEKDLERQRKVRTDNIDAFKASYAGATKGKTDDEVEVMMKQQRAFADIADRSLRWYQQAMADGQVTEDEKTLFAKNFADAGSYNIALSMGEEVVDFFKHSPEINEQNLFAFKDSMTQAFVQKGVDRNMAIMAADAIADNFGLTDTVNKVNEQKLSVKRAAEYTRDVAKARREGKEHDFMTNVGPGYSMFQSLSEVQKLQFQEHHPEAYAKIMKATNDSILNGTIQDNTDDIGATELSVKALEFGLIGDTGNKEIDAGQMTSAITGAVNNNTIPATEEDVASKEGFEKAKSNLEVLRPHITNPKTISLVANYGTPEVKAAYANKLGDYLKGQVLVARQSIMDSQWKDQVRYDAKKNRFVIAQDATASTLKNLAATNMYVILDRLNSTLSQIDSFTVMNEGQRQAAKDAFLNSFRDIVPDLAESEAVDEPNFLNKSLVFGDKVVEAIKESSETPGTVANVVRETANVVREKAQEIVQAPGEAVAEGIINITDPDYTGNVEASVKEIYDAIPEEVKTDMSQFFKGLTDTDTPVMRELKKIALNPAIEFGKEIIKNPLMSGEEWNYKYGKNGVVTKAYKQAWEDVKEGVKAVADWIKGFTEEEPTQYEEEQFTALDKKQEERTRKMIEELKKRK